MSKEQDEPLDLSASGKINRKGGGAAATLLRKRLDGKVTKADENAKMACIVSYILPSESSALVIGSL